jgi:hydroxymethylglutaryl-CoA reductase
LLGDDVAKISHISGFYKLPLDERLKIIKEFAGLTSAEVNLLKKEGALKLEQADRMIENVIGTVCLPLGIATNFLINDKDYLIPMAIEEPSVVAAASNAAKMAREKGGFTASSSEPLMIGQVQLVDVKNTTKARTDIIVRKDEIIKLANEQDPVLANLGGGAKDIEVKVLETPAGPMLVVHLIVDVRDAMGANAVNTMCEAVSPLLERITGGKARLRIISNLAALRLVRAEAVFQKEVLGGEEIVDGIIQAYSLAAADPYRCATHNKGIMNGVIAVAHATGNDTRALESGAHSFAAMKGKYQPLTTWKKTKEGDLLGRIELPAAVGIIGGATASNPTAKVCLKILGVKSACELGEVMACVGLANNLAAMRAIVAEGIQLGHMRLHARNIAIMAGATGDLIDQIAELMVREKKIRVDRAKDILEKLQKS